MFTKLSTIIEIFYYYLLQFPPTTINRKTPKLDMKIVEGILTLYELLT